MWSFPFHTNELSSLDWVGLKERFQWIRDMEHVEQDPIFHAEGNVEIHTRMVMEQMLSSDEFKALSDQDKRIQFAAVLLHDVEKRSTTKREFENGRETVTSKGHAKKGEFTAREILYRDIPTPFSIREMICKLVKHHALPIRIFDKDMPQKEVLRTSVECNNHMLATIARADMRGRKSLSNDIPELMYQIDTFVELCKENECYDTNGPFASDLTRFDFFQKESGVWVKQETFDDTTCDAYIMCGIPASGKSHYVNKHLSHLPVVSMDAIRIQHGMKRYDKTNNGHAIQIAKESAKEHLRRKQSFVWDATNVTRTNRESLINMIAPYNPKIHIVYVERPYKNVVSDNRDREHPVRADVLDNYMTKLDVPSLTEAHTVTYYVSE
jgi:predicted kinase